MHDPIECEVCGYIWDGTRLVVYANILDVPRMVLAARVRKNGCLTFGAHHMLTSDPPLTRPSRTRRYNAGMWDPQHGPANVDSRDIWDAYCDATRKPKGWRP